MNISPYVICPYINFLKVKPLYYTYSFYQLNSWFFAGKKFCQDPHSIIPENESVSCSVVSNFLRPHGLQPTRLLCLWNSPARILEWKAIPFSRESLNPGIKPGSPATQADSLPSEPPGIIPETLPQCLSFNVNISSWGSQVHAGEYFSLQAYMYNFTF